MVEWGKEMEPIEGLVVNREEAEILFKHWWRDWTSMEDFLEIEGAAFGSSELFRLSEAQGRAEEIADAMGEEGLELMEAERKLYIARWKRLPVHLRRARSHDQESQASETSPAEDTPTARCGSTQASGRTPHGIYIQDTLEKWWDVDTDQVIPLASCSDIPYRFEDKSCWVCERNHEQAETDDLVILTGTIRLLKKSDFR